MPASTALSSTVLSNSAIVSSLASDAAVKDSSRSKATRPSNDARLSGAANRETKSDATGSEELTSAALVHGLAASSNAIVKSASPAATRFFGDGPPGIFSGGGAGA